jgi:L-malate glycosyltransferase
MRVLYLTRSQSPHDLRFTRALAQTQHQVFVACLETPTVSDWPMGITVVQGVEPVTGKYWEAFSPRARQMRKIIKEVKPDLIHAGPIQQVAFWAVVAKFHPLVSMSWGSDLMQQAESSLWNRWVTRYTLGNSDVLVGDCDCVGQKAAQFGFPLDSYMKFPWGVDLEHFTPHNSLGLRQILGWQDKIVLLSNRSLEKLYGVEVVLKAFIKARESNPDLRLMLYGRGSQEQSLRQLTQQNDLQEDVHFGGFAEYDQLPEIYRSADLYLSASHSDGSSVSLMEALACGLPVIVSDIPGNREWVREGEEGWLFKDGNVKELTQKMLQAASQVKSFEQMKKGNRALAEDRADWTKNFPVLLQAYELALKQAVSHD